MLDVTKGGQDRKIHIGHLTQIKEIGKNYRKPTICRPIYTIFYCNDSSQELCNRRDLVQAISFFGIILVGRALLMWFFSGSSEVYSCWICNSHVHVFMSF